MIIQKVAINSIKNNPNNPRILKDKSFDKLVKSVKEFPEMLEIRPIVVDDDNMVLGGNMRLLACKNAGFKEVFIVKADNLTEEQKKEFIIKDNVGFGEWNYDLLANEWDSEELEDWGLDVDFVSIAPEDQKKEEELKPFSKGYILIEDELDVIPELEEILTKNGINFNSSLGNKYED